MADNPYSLRTSEANGAGGQFVRPLGIYIHIPFCIQKCLYCDFLSFPADEMTKDRYVQALTGQILRTDDTRQYEVVSIFIGGGTPSCLDAKHIVRILQAVHDVFRVSKFAEITIECNPGTVTAEMLAACRSAGINRLSFGVQAAQDSLLKALGRIHTWDDFLVSWKLSEKAGFDNRSLDLMSALPGQTRQMWEETLTKAVMLQPRHISAYGLIIEEGTPFWKLYHEDDERRAYGERPLYLPDEDTDRFMYRRTYEILAESGFERYEISNYALPGCESVHNIGYWQRREYLGYGLGASSQVGKFRFHNTEHMAEYLSSSISERISLADVLKNHTENSLWQDMQELTVKDEMEETMFLGLRMMRGVEKRAFAARFGRSMDDVYGEINGRLENQGLIRQTDTYICLTDRGIDISNAVLSEYLLD